MLRKVLVLSGVFALMCVTAVSVVTAADEAPPATYKSGPDLMAVLAKAASTGMATSPVLNESAYRINVVRRGKPGNAMAHATGPAKGTEVHYIIDGAATVVTGGTIQGSGASASIQNGVTHHLTKGDVLVIPQGTPHWYKEIEGSVTYLEVRFDVSSAH